ncbi:histidine kinase [Streptomyces sp. AM 4-1-1]|uniref:sensor histidine kinase n=1 Tax=Streptomyces sp. AM 4-1-1 TaxID=3028710 RepID=UPI0023B925A5|nr:histidine kinase [Streptomyces sp. AM 4-1-1]WEH34378.1 histidine kinase [Streptomyces sp. AM 4-1-1]
MASRQCHRTAGRVIVIARIRGWRRGWQERSRLQRIDLYSRGTVLALPWLFLLTWGLLPTTDFRQAPLPIALHLALLVTNIAQCVISNRNTGVAYRHYLGGTEFPRRRLVPALALLGVSVGLLAALQAVDGVGDEELLLVTDLPLAFAVPYVLLVPVRIFVVHCLGFTGLVVGVLAVAGLRGPMLAGLVPAVAFGCLLVLVSVRPGIWSLSVMWQAEEARDVQARLAVAEERLRFGRDMHDVLGRNLAVIALKSELAVELAQRGRPEAVDQMVEVQRIARTSQQEFRDVVRGYREADLRTELIGAQSVLRAAGIECGVEGDDGGGLPAPVRSTLGWVVREAATNVLRHGDPQRCVIRLTTSVDAVVLDVENDGAPVPVVGGSGTGAVGTRAVGMGTAMGAGRVRAVGAAKAVGAASSRPGAGVPGDGLGGVLSDGGSGLAGLRERLGALDGSLDAGPTGEDGRIFRLTARVPLRRPAGAGTGRREPVGTTLIVEESR